MGSSGESRGEVVRGELLITWAPRSQKFHLLSRWVVRDGRGDQVEMIDQTHVSHLPDDEWLERSLTRMARALAAETRSHTEERRDGVMRLL